MLTPGQIAELRSGSNCCGCDPVHGPLYLVRILPNTYKRVQELTALMEVHGILWQHSGRDDGRRLECLMTTHPEWFVELERKIEDANRPR